MQPIHRALAVATLLAAAATMPLAAQSGSFGNSVVIADGELLIAEPNTYFRAGTVYVYRKAGERWQESAKLQAPDAERADGFGAVLARTGTSLIVAQRGGRLHTFTRAGESWRYTGEIAAEITGLPAPCDQYGYCSTDFGIVLAAAGDWLLVGEPGRPPPPASAAPGSGGENGSRPQVQATAGVVHAFQRSADGTWTQRARLTPAGSAAGDAFGAAIAIEDGRALIGAPGWNVAGGDSILERAGRVFEFRLENGVWREAGVLPAEPDPNARFGAAIALQADAALVGAPGGDGERGVAFLYRRAANGAWTEPTRLTAAAGQAGDEFGSAVAIDGRDVWIGAPTPRGTETGTVYVYRGRANATLESRPSSIRLTETVTRDAFGERIGAHGGVVAVTAAGMHHQAGAVFVYERDAAGEWQDRGRLVSPPDALAALTGEERKCTDGRVGPFACEDVELLAFVPNSMLRAPEFARGVRTNDNWGWTDPETGREYALVGRNDGTSFVEITDPTNPVLVGDLPKTPDTPPSQLWRDMKVYDNHVFVVADGAGNHGMQVFDLRRLRNVPNMPALFEPDAHYANVASVHNIAINEETGFAYLVGARAGGETCGGGLHIVDIREPLNPKFAGCYLDERGTHDVQCVIYRGPDARYQGREICLKSNGAQFAISDVTDKDNPRFLARAAHPNPAYMHQGWLTDDHRYFFMDDESDVVRGTVETTRTLVWDLSDLEDPILAREFMGSMPASAHNLYIKGDTMYQANYRYGLHIVDISDPLNPREIGHFDTSPHNDGPGFSGAWSNYPFFESGTIVVTSLQEGLFLLKKRDSRVVF